MPLFLRFCGINSDFYVRFSGYATVKTVTQKRIVFSEFFRLVHKSEQIENAARKSPFRAARKKAPAERREPS